MSALAEKMPGCEITEPCDKASYTRVNRVLLDKHAEELAEAFARSKSARRSMPKPMSERFGKDFMKKNEDEPTIVGKYSF